jgi:hypothetical protein
VEVKNTSEGGKSSMWKWTSLFLMLLAIMFSFAGAPWGRDISNVFVPEIAAIGVPPDLMAAENSVNLMTNLSEVNFRVALSSGSFGSVPGENFNVKNEVIWPDHAVDRIRSGTMLSSSVF